MVKRGMSPLWTDSQATLRGITPKLAWADASRGVVHRGGSGAMCLGAIKTTASIEAAFDTQLGLVKGLDGYQW